MTFDCTRPDPPSRLAIVALRQVVGNMDVACASKSVLNRIRIIIGNHGIVINFGIRSILQTNAHVATGVNKIVFNDTSLMPGKDVITQAKTYPPVTVDNLITCDRRCRMILSKNESHAPPKYHPDCEYPLN